MLTASVGSVLAGVNLGRNEKGKNGAKKRAFGQISGADTVLAINNVRQIQ
jgi:hypothetical protein